LIAKVKRYLRSDTGNRTPVSRVTGGDTSHYTMSDWLFNCKYRDNIYCANIIWFTYPLKHGVVSQWFQKPYGLVPSTFWTDASAISRLTALLQNCTLCHANLNYCQLPDMSMLHVYAKTCRHWKDWGCGSSTYGGLWNMPWCRGSWNSTKSCKCWTHDLACQVAANLATFSNAYPFTAARAAKTAPFLADGIPPHMKRAILTDVSTTIQWMLVSHQQVTLVTHPVVTTNATGDPIFLASLGDTLAQAIPVSFLDLATLGSPVVVLVTQDKHTTLSLPAGCATAPGQLDPSPNANGTLSAEQAGIGRLHFDTSGGSGHAPVFSVLPMVYPLALGKTPVLQPIAAAMPGVPVKVLIADLAGPALRLGTDVVCICAGTPLWAVRNTFLPAHECANAQISVFMSRCAVTCCAAINFFAPYNLSSNNHPVAAPPLWGGV
jgi:hypothetical protein